MKARRIERRQRARALSTGAVQRKRGQMRIRNGGRMLLRGTIYEEPPRTVPVFAAVHRIHRLEEIAV